MSDFTAQDVMTGDEDTGEQVILRGWTEDRYAIYDVRLEDGSYARRIAGMSEENFYASQRETETKD